MSDPKIIRTNINNIRILIQDNQTLINDDMDKFDELVKLNHTEFIEQYPTIYQKLKDNTLDEEKLQYMLDMITDINSKKTSEFDASVQVGQKLVDHYVKPKLNK